jgi:hypothetical protein
MVLHQTKAGSRILLFGGFFDNGKETRWGTRRAGAAC